MEAANGFVLTCGSTADMPASFFESRRIAYIPFHYTLDGTEYPDDLGQSVPFETFYRRLASGSWATTSQINVDEFLCFFEPFLRAGRDVIHVSLSSGLSGAYGSAVVAAEELGRRYPERKIAVVDSLGASSGYGLLMELLADMRDAGASFEEICGWAEENKLYIHHWFFSTDLTFYMRGGRISKSAGMFGTLLNICPLLNMDETGHLIPREKIRTKKRVMRAIVDRMREHAKGGTDYDGRCFMCHSACYDDARAVADLIEAEFPRLERPVEIHDIGTVIGSHTGPGTVAVFFVGDRRV